MRVFLFDLKIFSEINKKEEITPNTYLITDQEEYELSQIMNGSVIGKVWVENRELRWSKSPGQDFDWVESSKSWVMSESRYQARLNSERNLVWDKIKELRSFKNSGGVYLSQIDKWFHTDPEARQTYLIVGQEIILGIYKPKLWKTYDNSFVEMTEDLFKELMKSMSEAGEHNFRTAEVHRNALYLSDDPKNYDYSTGWSESYINHSSDDSVTIESE